MLNEIFIKIYRKLLFLVLAVSICSCSNGLTGDGIYTTECPRDIGQKIVYYAAMYAGKNTKYEWGGQDFLEENGIIKIDCSGLVVNCLRYAITGTNYSLLFNDAAVLDFYNEWTIQIKEPRPGDIIFMGENGSLPPPHLSIFVRKDNVNIYFIDATLKEEENIDGVSERHYPINDSKFISFGRLLLGCNK